MFLLLCPHIIYLPVSSTLRYWCKWKRTYRYLLSGLPQSVFLWWFSDAPGWECCLFEWGSLTQHASALPLALWDDAASSLPVSGFWFPSICSFNPLASFSHTQDLNEKVLESWRHTWRFLVYKLEGKASVLIKIQQTTENLAYVTL